MSENQQALNHVVSMEDLTVDQVMKLIKRGIEFKNGAQLPYEDHPIVSNLFFPATATKMGAEAPNSQKFWF